MSGDMFSGLGDLSGGGGGGGGDGSGMGSAPTDAFGSPGGGPGGSSADTGGTGNPLDVNQSADMGSNMSGGGGGPGDFGGFGGPMSPSSVAGTPQDAVQVAMNQQTMSDANPSGGTGQQSGSGAQQQANASTKGQQTDAVSKTLQQIADSLLGGNNQGGGGGRSSGWIAPTGANAVQTADASGRIPMNAGYYNWPGGNANPPAGQDPYGTTYTTQPGYQPSPMSPLPAYRPQPAPTGRAPAPTPAPQPGPDGAPPPLVNQGEQDQPQIEPKGSFGGGSPTQQQDQPSTPQPLPSVPQPTNLGAAPTDAFGDLARRTPGAFPAPDPTGVVTNPFSQAGYGPAGGAKDQSRVPQGDTPENPPKYPAQAPQPGQGKPSDTSDTGYNFGTPTPVKTTPVAPGDQPTAPIPGSSPTGPGGTTAPTAATTPPVYNQANQGGQAAPGGQQPQNPLGAIVRMLFGGDQPGSLGNLIEQALGMGGQGQGQQNWAPGYGPSTGVYNYDPNIEKQYAPNGRDQQGRPLNDPKTGQPPPQPATNQPQSRPADANKNQDRPPGVSGKTPEQIRKQDSPNAADAGTFVVNDKGQRVKVKDAQGNPVPGVDENGNPTGKTGGIRPDTMMNKATEGGQQGQYGPDLSSQVQRGSANFMGSRRAAQMGVPRTMTTMRTPWGQNLRVNAAAAPHFQSFLQELHDRGYNVTDISGYANRNIPGTHTPSQHSYGNAIDINPGPNGYWGWGTGNRTNLPPDISDIAARHGLTWGGNWRNRDNMHFEWTGAGYNQPVTGRQGSMNTGAGNTQLAGAVPYPEIGRLSSGPGISEGAGFRGSSNVEDFRDTGTRPATPQQRAGAWEPTFPNATGDYPEDQALQAGLNRTARNMRYDRGLPVPSVAERIPVRPSWWDPSDPYVANYTRD